jgi:hypothetical protein
MATLGNPYSKIINVYNPQRSAGVGQRTLLPEEYFVGYRPRAGTATPLTVDDILYAGAVESPLGGAELGPGPGGTDTSGNATAFAPFAPPMEEDIPALLGKAAILGVPSAVTSIFGKSLAYAGKATDANLFGGKIGGLLTKGEHAMSDALGIDAFGQSQGAFGEKGASTDLGFIGQEIAANEVPQPSPLADIGIGGSNPSSGNIGSGFAIGTGEYGGYEGAMGGYGPGGIGGGGGGFGGGASPAPGH